VFKNDAKTTVSGNLGVALKSFIRRLQSASNTRKRWS